MCEIKIITKTILIHLATNIKTITKERICYQDVEWTNTRLQNKRTLKQIVK